MSRIDARKIPHPVREKIRMEAIRDWKRGMRPVDMIRKYGVSGKTVHEWINRYEAGGTEGLRTRAGRGGARSKLLPAQRGELASLIRTETPRDYGFDTTLWTCRIVAMVIRKKFNVVYSESGARSLLHRLDFTPQKLRRHALRRDRRANSTR